jgi:hypothetical protein
MKKLILSLLAVTSISFGASAQAFIPEAGFENWSSPGFGAPVQPNGWISGNIFNNQLWTQNAGIVFASQAGTPDNFQGTYSLKLQTKTLNYNPDTNTIPNTFGYCLTGSVLAQSPYIRPGYATQQRPVSLSYEAKYTPVGVDTAFCIVALTHWNGVSRDTVAAGLDFMSTTIPNYVARTITLVYNPLFVNTFPDSATIWFNSSSFVTPQVNSTLFVDALAFTGYVGVNEVSQNNGVAVYPNPSSTFTTFDVTAENAYEVVVYDMTGREVSASPIVNKKGIVDSFKMTSGIYTYSIISKDAEVLSRGKFTVTE